MNTHPPTSSARRPAGAIPLLLIAAVVLAVLAGCGESAPRAATDTLLAAVEKARALCDQALAALARPAMTGGEGDAVRLAEPHTPPSPQIYQLLASAETRLRDAMSETAQTASGQAQALAMMQLARVNRLRGTWHVQAAKRHEAAFQDRLESARATLERLGRVSARQAVLAESETSEILPKLREQIPELQQTRQQAREQVEKLKSQIDELAGTLEKRTAEASQLLSTARDLQIRSEAPDAPDGLWQESLQARNRSNDLAAEAIRLEHEIQLLQPRLELAEKDHALAEKRLAAAEARLAELTDRQKEARTRLAEARGQSEDLRTLLQQQILEMGRAASALAEQQGQALEFLRSATRNASVARQRAAAEPALAAEAASQSGDAEMALANLLIGQGAWRDRLEGLAETFSGDSAAAEAAAALPAAYMPDPAAARRSALDALDSAAEAYRRALRSQRDRERRWVYQGQLARALVRWGELADDAAQARRARDEALALLEEALANREHSPYLQPLRALRSQILRDLQEGA